MLVSAQALTVTMFGGVGTVWGPVIGSAILIPAAEILQAQFGAQLPGIQGVIFGFAIVVVILAAPEGLFWRVRDRCDAAGQAARDRKTKFAAADEPTPLLSAHARAAAGSQPQNELARLSSRCADLSRSLRRPSKPFRM